MTTAIKVMSWSRRQSDLVRLPGLGEAQQDRAEALSGRRNATEVEKQTRIEIDCSGRATHRLNGKCNPGLKTKEKTDLSGNITRV